MSRGRMPPFAQPHRSHVPSVPEPTPAAASAWACVFAPRASMETGLKSVPIAAAAPGAAPAPTDRQPFVYPAPLEADRALGGFSTRLPAQAPGHDYNPYDV